MLIKQYLDLFVSCLISCIDIYVKMTTIKLNASKRRIGKCYIFAFKILNHEIADESIVKHVRSLLVYLSCIVCVQMNLPVLIC